jgi:hypothetical protein
MRKNKIKKEDVMDRLMRRMECGVESCIRNMIICDEVNKQQKKFVGRFFNKRY